MSSTDLEHSRDPLAARYVELWDEIEELRACVAAAADGNTKLAEIYLAGGALGVRRAEGNWTCSLSEHKIKGRGRVRTQVTSRDLFLLRRLWVDPICADSFGLCSLTVGNREVLDIHTSGWAVPCGLFSKRYGSPLFHEVVGVGVVVAVEVENMTREVHDFRAVLLGYSLPRQLR